MEHRRTMFVAFIGVLSLAFTGCRASLEPPSFTPEPATTATLVASVIITGHADGAPSQCTTEEVTARLVSLYEGINREDRDVTSEYFSRSSFTWYCMHEPDEPHTVYDLDELGSYFEQRYEQHETLRLVSITFNGWDEPRGLLHFGPFVIERTADDLDSVPTTVLGKGAYHCETRTFAVLCSG
jgi:hypothetical protein